MKIGRVSPLPQRKRDRMLTKYAKFDQFMLYVTDHPENDKKSFI